MHDTASQDQTPASETTRGKFIFEILRRTKLGVMPAGCKLVLLSLADFMNHQHVAWPCQDALMASTGASLTQVKSALEKLERAGWVVVLFRGTGRVSTQYKIQIGRPIEVPREVSEATGRYKRSVLARGVLKRMHEGTITPERANEELEALSGRVTDSCRIELDEAGLQTGAKGNYPGCSQKPPSPPAEGTDPHSDPSMDPPNGTSRACAGARAESHPRPGDPSTSTPTSTASSTVRPITKTSTPTSKPISDGLTSTKVDDAVPSTNRSPTSDTSAKAEKKPMVNTETLFPSKPADPSGALCVASDLLSWIATNPVYEVLKRDPIVLKRWTEKMGGTFAMTATRSRDVHASLVKFIARNAHTMDDMTNPQLFGALGSWLSGAHRYPDRPASKFAKKDRCQPATPKNGAGTITQAQADADWDAYLQESNGKTK